MKIILVLSKQFFKIKRGQLLVRVLWRGGRVCHVGRWVSRIWGGLSRRRFGARWWIQPGGQKGVSQRSWLGLQRCSWPVRYRRSCRIGPERSMLFSLFLCQWCPLQWLPSIPMHLPLYTWWEIERMYCWR